MLVNDMLREYFVHSQLAQCVFFSPTVLQSLADEKEKTNVKVDAVHVKVEQTHKDVQDIKGILESCKSINL